MLCDTASRGLCGLKPRRLPVTLFTHKTAADGLVAVVEREREREREREKFIDNQ